MTQDDPRRNIPRTDTLLALPGARAAAARIGEPAAGRVVREVQQQAREGRIAPEDVQARTLSALAEATPSSMRPVLNATGIIVHTNLGRAPLSQAAIEALAGAAGYVDVEMDLASGARSRRGAGARAALLAACPEAEEAVVVNNGAAALVLATTALAGTGEVVLSRGEMIEIGAGFRLPDLIASTGATLREVGSTNRTHRDDYLRALAPGTGCILKVHPSNYRISGFTSEVPVAELSEISRDHGVPLVVDVGSGLLRPNEVLPEEPDIAGVLRAGADVVIASGDKLLGGPQAGLLLGRAAVLTTLARHPLARAMRADKLTLAALEATLTGGPTPVTRSLNADVESLRRRTVELAAALDAETVAHDGRVGGGGAPEVPLPGWAIRLPEHAAEALRTGTPPIVTRVRDGMCLLDLRCVPESADEVVLRAARSALRHPPQPPAAG